MARLDDIVAYTYRAATYCPICIVDQLATGEGQDFDGWALAEGANPMATEDNLNEIAFAFGIDRQDERSFDSDYFPKVVFRDQLEPSEEGIDDNEHCHGCGRDLEEVVVL